MECAQKKKSIIKTHRESTSDGTRHQLSCFRAGPTTFRQLRCPKTRCHASSALPLRLALFVKRDRDARPSLRESSAPAAARNHGGTTDPQNLRRRGARLRLRRRPPPPLFRPLPPPVRLRGQARRPAGHRAARQSPAGAARAGGAVGEYDPVPGSGRRGEGAVGPPGPPHGVRAAGPRPVRRVPPLQPEEPGLVRPRPLRPLRRPRVHAPVRAAPPRRVRRRHGELLKETATLSYFRGFDGGSENLQIKIDWLVKTGVGDFRAAKLK